MSYSQNAEDLFVLNYFKGSKGTLLEIGANDGVTFSNSFQMIKEGWSAHLIEPSAAYADLVYLYGNHPNVHLHNIGLGSVNGTMTLHESGAHVPGGRDCYLVSTMVERERERWNNVDFKPTEIEVQTFDKWWNNAGRPKLDFISIDAEGMDWGILQQIDLAKAGCQCLCIEWNSNERLKRLYTDYCIKYSLRPIHINAENIIYAIA